MRTEPDTPGPSDTPARPATHSRWSRTIGKIAGIEVQVHVTFLLLLAWVAFAEYERMETAAAAVAGVVFMLAVFASVVLHEYGHALTALRFGVRTRAITLLPIGGVAQLEKIPERPSQEFAVAAAGPVVTIVLVFILYVVLRANGMPMDARPVLAGTGGSFLARLFWINVVLAIFNLLPAFPMDGGRVLRATLAMRMGYGRATEIAARIGKAFALVFGIIGLLVVGNPFLVLIAVFVWIGAAAEAAAIRLKTAVDGILVARVMVTDIRTLLPGDPLSVAVDHVLGGFQHDFPVVRDGAVVGVLTRADLLRALAEGRQGVTVGDVMQSHFSVAAPTEMLDAALARLQTDRGGQTLPVVRDGRLVGVLTLETIGEFVAIQSALQQGRSGDQPVKQVVEHPSQSRH